METAHSFELPFPSISLCPYYLNSIQYDVRKLYHRNISLSHTFFPSRISLTHTQGSQLCRILWWISNTCWEKTCKKIKYNFKKKFTKPWDESNVVSLKRLDYAKTINRSLLHTSTTAESAKKTTTTCITYDPPQLNLPVGFFRNKASQTRSRLWLYLFSI